MGCGKAYNHGGLQHAAEKLEGSFDLGAQERPVAGLPISGC